MIRQLRVFAEPVLAGDTLVALRGAFQDVSVQYHTQVALAATRDQLADSEQRAAEEHQLAIRLQRAIMVQDEPPVAAAGVDVAVRYRQAEAGHLVGGDWYDVLPLPNEDLLLVVGDITGHGIDAVTGMIAARNALRGLAATGAGPAELLGHLNYAACHLTEGIAGTVVCGQYEPKTRMLRWARAGHLPPVLVRDVRGRALPLPEGVLLGLDPTAQYEEASTQLKVGDTLLLFTDGLIERRSGSISDMLHEFSQRAAQPAPTPVTRRPHPQQRPLRHRRRRLPSRLPHPVTAPRPRHPMPVTRDPATPCPCHPATPSPRAPVAHGPAPAFPAKPMIVCR